MAVLGSIGSSQLIDYFQLPGDSSPYKMVGLVNSGPSCSQIPETRQAEWLWGINGVQRRELWAEYEMRLKSRRASLTRVPRLAGGPHPIKTTDPGWQFAEHMHPTTLSIFWFASSAPR